MTPGEATRLTVVVLDLVAGIAPEKALLVVRNATPFVQEIARALAGDPFVDPAALEAAISIAKWAGLKLD